MPSSDQTPTASPDPSLAAASPTITSPENSPLTPARDTLEAGRNGIATSLVLRDNPAYGRSSDMPAEPSRASSDSRSATDAASLDEASLAPTAALGASKRPPRKLTKNRNSSEGITERSRAVLQKKNPPVSPWQSQVMEGSDGVPLRAGENIPLRYPTEPRGRKMSGARAFPLLEPEGVKRGQPSTKRRRDRHTFTSRARGGGGAWLSCIKDPRNII